MKDILIQKVRDFLQAHFCPGKPVLIAFSGGPDSLSLVHAFIECKRFFSLDIHLAHIDHGWREESRRESLDLKEKMESLGLKFHLKTLRSCDFDHGNKENRARDLRHRFFKEVYQAINAQSLVLAHQQDDLAETVLKRIFEGGGIFSWSSMQETSRLHDMYLWRPLLSLPKKEILSWLKNRNINYYVVDRTNLDPKFLRGKMRKEIFPYLEELFGKNIVSSLCSLSEDAAWVTEPLIKLFEQEMQFCHKGLLGTYIDFDQMSPLTLQQLPLFIRYFMQQQGMHFSRPVLRDITQSIQNACSAKQFETALGTVFIDRRKLFISKGLPQFSSSVPIKEGRWKIGGWSYEIRWESLNPSSLKEKTSSWKEAFDGSFSVDLPEGSYFLASHEVLKSLSIKDFLSKRFSSSKVPFFLRSLFPFVIHNDELIHEFLSGKKIKKCSTDSLKRLSIRLLRDEK